VKYYRLTDNDNNEVYVNPSAIRYLRLNVKAGKGTQMYFDKEHYLFVLENPDEVLAVFETFHDS